MRYPDDEGLTRKEQTTLSRLRSGHHPALRYWRHKMNLEAETGCRVCGGAEETALHALTDCDAVKHMYPQGWKPHGLVTDTRKALEIWRKWRSIVEANTGTQLQD